MSRIKAVMFNQYLAERFASSFNSQIEAINKHHIINALLYLKVLSNKHPPTLLNAQVH